MYGLVDHCKDFGFYSLRKGRPLEGLETRGDMLYLKF